MLLCIGMACRFFCVLVCCVGSLELIHRKRYFVIHAARQSGKTTLLKELLTQINAGEQYHALYCSLESIENITEPERGIPAIAKKFKAQISRHRTLCRYPFAQDADHADFTNVLNMSLTWFCKSLARYGRNGSTTRRPLPI